MKHSISNIPKHSDGTIGGHNRRKEGTPPISRQPLLLGATALCLALSLTACGNTTGERALSGGGIGAGVGAVGSAVTGGSPWTGAAIGGAVGAATGALTDEDQIDLDD